MTMGDTKSVRVCERDTIKNGLAATTKTKDKMKGGLLLDVVIRESTTILKLLAGEDQALLVWGDTLLVLNLGLDIVDRVG